MTSLTPSRSFYGLRHGATDWNREGRFQGRTDNPLNDDGIRQAHAAADLLRGIGITRIVTSPLVRAAKTAEIIAATIPAPLTIDDGIIECDFGSFEGLSVRAAMEEHGVRSAEGLISILPADGEAWNDVTERSLRCVSQWLQRHPDDHLLFVCHDAVMQALARALCGNFFQNRHGTPFRFVFAGEGWRVAEVAIEGKHSQHPPAT
jgi:probable phosphoglycerate mutase